MHIIFLISTKITDKALITNDELYNYYMNSFLIYYIIQ